MKKVWTRFLAYLNIKSHDQFEGGLRACDAREARNWQMFDIAC